MKKNESIQILLLLVAELSDGALLHKLQGQTFKAQGFSKLGSKYEEHYAEEMEWVEKFTDRILDLGGSLKLKERVSHVLIEDPIEYLKAELVNQQKGVDLLAQWMVELRDDHVTYSLLLDYLKDEEEDLFWYQGALELIGKIGEQNWLVTQLYST